MCIPEGVSFDKLNLMLIAYLKAGADQKPVNYKDASVRSGIRPSDVSRNNKFFVYAGFLEEEKRGVLGLTEEGAKYAQLMDWGRLEEAKKQLNRIISRCSLVDIITAYVKIKGEVTREDLRKKIGSDIGVSKASRFKVGINALLDMLVFSELIVEDHNMLRSGVEEFEIEEIPVETKEERLLKVTPSHLRKRELASFLTKPEGVSFPISLTVNVDEKTDVEKLREILRAIKEELFMEKEKTSQN